MIGDPEIRVGLQNFPVLHFDTAVLIDIQQVSQLVQLGAGQRPYGGKTETSRRYWSGHAPSRSKEVPILSHAVHLVLLIRQPWDVHFVGVVPSGQAQCCPLRAAIDGCTPHGAGQASIFYIRNGADDVTAIVPEVSGVLIPRGVVLHKLTEHRGENPVPDDYLPICHGSESEERERSD
ncbi:hypothetical protein KC19_12G021000 [Ceratodon purpureus]|uniref:Uncharacterized protein n=1 Tax=Ceratodon purpureus TaxID=3225 RepID=A0A8T0G2V8_CERPU|nr:hypothetical protein KC19_12G021000 [Ceratodon purpureus]